MYDDDHDEYEGYRSPDEIADENAEYARDAAYDALLDKHPRRVIPIEISIDFIQGFWMEYKRPDGVTEDVDSDFAVDDFLANLRPWLQEKLNQYIRSQKKGRRFPAAYCHVDVNDGLDHFRDGHVQFRGFGEGWSQADVVCCSMRRIFDDGGGYSYTLIKLPGVGKV